MRLTKLTSPFLNAYILLLVMFISIEVHAQFSCGPNTPTFNVNLSSDPNLAWQSPDTNRIDTCCGAAGNSKCVGFEITLHPDAEGIIFTICDGAVPPGALYYKVGCDDSAGVGQALCLSGVGPHYITFCKPGNNSNVYCIQSIAEPAPGPNIGVGDGCNGQMWVQGYDPDSVSWTSVYPGAIGDYDSYLDCTSGCDTVNVTGQTNAPDTVLYQVCGPLLGDCDSLSYCDTIAAYFFTTLESVISPEQPVVCDGDSGTYIYAGGNGGSPPYSYLWNTGDTADSIFVNVGTYVLEVSDTTGCPPAYDTVTVTSFNLPILANAGNDTTYCESAVPVQLNGSVQIASGGSWIGEGGLWSPDSTSLSTSYSPTAAELSAGFTEFLLITTGNATCPADTDTLVVDYHQYNTQLFFDSLQPSCNGFSDGSFWLNGTLGTSISSVVWQTNPLQYGDTALNLDSGLYQVLVTDSFGCDSLFDVQLSHPEPLELLQDSLFNVSCFGYSDGLIGLSGSGGTSPYSFAWNSGHTSGVLPNLTAGNYAVTLTDTNQCQDTLSFTISQPEGIVLSGSTVDVLCNGESTGAANVSATGPYSNYQYEWSTGSTNAIIFNLTAGVYQVTATYGNSCLDSMSVTILEPDSIEISHVANDITCAGFDNGEIFTSSVGGTLPYTFAWSNGSSNDSLFDLGPGSYVLTLTDFNDCVENLTLDIDEPDTLEIDGIISDVSCFGGDDGVINITASGGVVPYSYNWSNSSNDSTITNLTIGNYSVTVTDSNGCDTTQSFQVVQPPELDVSFQATDITCYDGNDGMITTSVNGGVSPYSYTWNNGATTPNNTNVFAGYHVVTITDANGCVINYDTLLTQPDPISIQVSQETTICLYTNAAIFVIADGGNGGYVYQWSDSLSNAESHVVSPLETTTYSVTVTDSTGCPPDVGSVKIIVKPVVFDSIVMSLDPKAICHGDTSSLSGDYLGDLNEYDFLWSHGFGNEPGTFSLSPDSNTQYSITVTDDCGFTKVDSIELIVNPRPILNFPEDIASGCVPLEVDFENGIVGVPISEYDWDFGDFKSSSLANPTHIYNTPGSYTVSLVAFSDKGCESEGANSGTVSVYENPTADFTYSPEDLTTAESQIQTENLSSGAVTYGWTISDGAVYSGENIEHTFSEWGNYIIDLLVENQYGCIDTISRPVYVDPVIHLVYPTAFTPNGGLQSGYYDPTALDNNVFYLITNYVQDFHLVIYNRWGETVFESFDPSFGWNGYYKGELAPVAAYVWRADIEFVNGKKITETGHVSVLH